MFEQELIKLDEKNFHIVRIYFSALCTEYKGEKIANYFPYIDGKLSSLTTEDD